MGRSRLVRPAPRVSLLLRGPVFGGAAVRRPASASFVHTGLGEHDRAIDLLEQAFERRDGAVYAMKGSFLPAPLRPHPRFQALLERMKQE